VEAEEPSDTRPATAPRPIGTAPSPVAIALAPSAIAEAPSARLSLR
jgi:hypothetical protein